MTKPNESIHPIDASGDFTDGITKREYFAALAMQGIIASHAVVGRPNRAHVADSAVQYADELIEALNAVEGKSLPESEAPPEAEEFSASTPVNADSDRKDHATFEFEDIPF